MANTVIRWNPIREMAAMQSAMDRLFENTWRDYAEHLPLDVHETDDSYVVTTNLPGMNADDIDINLQDNVLTIRAETQQPEVDEKTRVVVQERTYGKMIRSVTLPMKIDSENVDAEYHDGVLTLTLHKAPEAQPRRITIKNQKQLKSGK